MPSGILDIMKKAAFLFIVSFILSVNVFADTMDFGVRWYVSNAAVTELSIIPYSGEGVFPKIVIEGESEAVSHTEIVTDSTDFVNVCRIRFMTNVHALYDLTINATSLYCKANESYARYTLKMTADDVEHTYNVERDYTLESPGLVLQLNMWGNGRITKDILVDGSFVEINSMASGSYNASIKVEVAKV